MTTPTHCPICELTLEDGKCPAVEVSQRAFKELGAGGYGAGSNDAWHRFAGQLVKIARKPGFIRELVERVLLAAFEERRSLRPAPRSCGIGCGSGTIPQSRTSTGQA